MPEFKESRNSYLQAKHAYRKAASEMYLARQQVLLLEKKISAFLLADLSASLPADHPLMAEQAAAQLQSTKMEAAAQSAKNALDAARLDFNNIGNASQTVVNLNDSIPILLLPLRIQTRFVTTRHIARNWPVETMTDFNTLTPLQKHQVQTIFPHVAAPASVLKSESSQAFSLSSHTSVAANNLIAELTHTSIKRWKQIPDVHELWVRIFPDEIFLQTHETALTETEADAAKIFWQGTWLAEKEFRLQSGDPAAALKTKNEKQLESWKTLRSKMLPHRASWSARVMRPQDFPDNFPTNMDGIPDDKFPVPGKKAESWTIPPSTDILPEHFIVKLFFNNGIPPREITGAAVPDYVQMGFEPDEKDDGEVFSPNENVLTLPASIRWITDMAEAEKAGMALRVELSAPEFAAGISRLVVVGIKTGADETEASRLLISLFDNHHYRPDGMAFLPQGTATNNLPGQASGFSQAGISDEEAYDNEFGVSTNDDEGTDGYRLTTALGLPQNAFINIANNGRREGSQALSANRALWPGSLGYYLDNFMRPNLTDTDIAFTKKFFQSFVTGSGLLPSFRVGKQPYGIIPSTAWSAWKPDTSASAEEKRLVNFLKKLDGQWEKMIDKVKTMKKVFANTNEDQLKKDFRELISCQASSTRYFRRLVAGEYLLWNGNHMTLPLNSENLGIKTTPNLYKTSLESSGQWNGPVNPRPRALGRFFDDDNYKLTDLSPDALAGLNRMNDKGENYLSILLDAEFGALKSNSFGEAFNSFVSERSSKLMFYLARFALLQGWVDAATALLKKEHPSISPFARLDFEMEYILEESILSNEHKALLNASGIPGNFETRKNKWSFFEHSLNDGTSVGKKIADRLKENLLAEDPVKNLQETRSALSELSVLPAERLERLFSEHIDCCSFRLDAWLQGLVLSRLFITREKAGFEKGIFIGSYGYLEELMPGQKSWIQVKEVELTEMFTRQEIGVTAMVMPILNLAGLTPDKLKIARKNIFVYLGNDPATSLVEDPVTKKIVQQVLNTQDSAGGYILTPSLEHAATAAILRAGYDHHTRSAGPDSTTLAVNIGSERTGLAVDMLKAVNAGHSLNEQLGYFIERKMYENAALAQFIPNLRPAFPLHIERNEWDDDQQIDESNKVKNLALVTDGLAIIQSFQSVATDPTDWNNKLSSIFGSQAATRTAFEKIVEQALDQFDAINDLVLAESVYQTVKGSPERAAAALRMVGEGAGITLPELVDIPAESKVLTHRMGFVLNATGNSVDAWPAGSTITSLFTRISPAINNWLTDQLPASQRIVAGIRMADNSLLKLKIGSTGIQPIDLFYLFQKTGRRLEESVLSWLFTEAGSKLPGVDPKNIAGVSFERHETFAPDELSIAEIIPLLRTIGPMLAQGKPMRPADWQLTSTNTPDGLYDNSLLLSVLTEFTGIHSTARLYIQKLELAKTALEKDLPAGFNTAESEEAFHQLIRLVPEAFSYGVWDAMPRCPDICNRVNADVLLDQTIHVMGQLTKKVEDATSAFAQIVAQSSTLTGDKIFDMLSTLAKQLVGEDFLILPSFRLPDPAGIKATLDDPTLAASIGEFGLEEWLQGLSMVRENIQRYQVLNNLRTIFHTPARARNCRVLQLPFMPGINNYWIATKFPEGYQPPAQATAMAYEFSTAFDVTQSIAGILIDDWKEKIPEPDLTAGVSINYDQSNAEAPQCLLLLVAPEMKGSWEWSSIVGSVLETMMLAKKRAVDSEIVQATWLSQFLPAVVAPVDAKNNTPNFDFKWAGPIIKPDLHGPMDHANPVLTQ